VRRIRVVAALIERGIDSTPGALYARVEHRYAELEVELSLFRTQIPLDAQPRALEAQEVRWVLRTAMPSLSFLEADIALVKRIASEPAPS